MDITAASGLNPNPNLKDLIMRESYTTDVIREKMPEQPFKLEGEVVEFEGGKGMPFTGLVVSIILTFIPPFLWGPATFLFMRHQQKKSGYWVSNQRLVSYLKVPFFRRYNVTSIPISQIAKVKIANRSSLINRMLGVADVKVFVKDSRWVQCYISDVKTPKKLLQHLKSKVTIED